MRTPAENLAKLHLLEATKSKHTPREFKQKFDTFTKELQNEELAETIKEAAKTLPDGYNTRAFIRKLVNNLLIRYGHKPQKTDIIPGKTRVLLYDLGINF